VRLTQGEALIDVNQRSLTVPAELLHIVPIRPQVWSVVPRPLDAVDLPLSWGDRYAVCPNCSARAPLGERVPSMSCTRWRRVRDRLVARSLSRVAEPRLAPRSSSR